MASFDIGDAPAAPPPTITQQRQFRVAIGAGNLDLQNPIQCVSRTEMHNETSSNGTDINANVRCEHQVSPDYGVSELQLVYSNWQVAGTAVTPSDTGTLTLRASIEYPAGTFYPVFFNGSRDATIQSGAQVLSDSVGLSLPAGTKFWSRAYVQVLSGQKWPQGFITNSTEGTYTPAGWFLKGTTQTDMTTSGSSANSFGYAFSPIAVIGKSNNNVKQVAVGLVGDSLMHAPNPNSAGYYYHRSAYTEALYGQVPFIQGAKAGNFASTVLGNPYLLNTIGKYTTHVICNIGVNDFRTGQSLSTIQSNLSSIWQYFAQRGIKVYQCTITPNSTSTDGWITTGNQTKSTYDATRTALNSWIRTTPAPLVDYIEIADLSEPSRDAGIWLANVTSDGLHPNPAAFPSGGTALLNTWKSAVSGKIAAIKST